MVGGRRGGRLGRNCGKAGSRLAQVLGPASFGEPAEKRGTMKMSGWLKKESAEKFSEGVTRERLRNG